MNELKAQWFDLYVQKERHLAAIKELEHRLNILGAQILSEPPKNQDDKKS